MTDVSKIAHDCLLHSTYGWMDGFFFLNWRQVCRNEEVYFLFFSRGGSGTIGGVWMFKCPTAPGSPNGLITRSRDKPKVSALPIIRDI